jgi:hypothetical protein
LRQTTEFSTKPNAFDVTVEGSRAIVTFYTDVTEIERQEQEGTVTAWTATAWTMTVPNQEGLAERIEKNPDLWLTKVETVTAAEESAAKLKVLEKTATDDAVCELAEIVADLTGAVTELASMIAGM